MSYTEQTKKKKEQQHFVLSSFFIKRTIVFEQDELMNIEISQIELFADDQPADVCGL